MRRLIAVGVILAYTAGLHWIFISLHDYGDLPAWLAALATLLLSIYVSAFTLTALALCRWLGLKSHQWWTPFIVAGIFTLAEWLRGTLLTGFPWLALGYLAIDTPLAGFAPIVGVYGVGFLAVLSLVWAAQSIRHRSWAAFGGIIVVVLGGFSLQQHPFTEPTGAPLRVALVQGAIEQSMKFDPNREAQALQTHLELARPATGPGGAQLIVFPETALVRPWDLVTPQTREAFYRLTQSGGASVMLGLPLRDADGYRNSLIAIHESTPPGQFSHRYDKHHLVPFGEFIPWGFRWFVDMMKMPLGDFQRGRERQSPIPIRDQRIGVNICFEDLFGEELIRPLAPELSPDQHPTILLNISNLAWFGDTIALSQHLSIARMRAMETGRPMIRATNTGATAAIDHRGIVTDQIAFARPGLLLTQVRGTQGLTPFVRWGNQPILALSLFLLASGLLLKARRR